MNTGCFKKSNLWFGKVCSSTQDILNGVLGGKEGILIFIPFKKGLQNGHTSNKTALTKITMCDFIKHVEVAGGKRMVYEFLG